MWAKTNVSWFYVRMNEFKLMKVYEAFLQIFFNCFSELIYLLAKLHSEFHAVVIDKDAKSEFSVDLS